MITQKLSPELQAKYDALLARQGLSNDIVAGIHYPVPTHLMPAYVQGTKSTLCLPNAERIAKKVVSLPIYPELAESDQYRVINALKDFF